jgi:hypothetical protein
LILELAEQILAGMSIEIIIKGKLIILSILDIELFIFSQWFSRINSIYIRSIDIIYSIVYLLLL